MYKIDVNSSKTIGIFMYVPHVPPATGPLF